MKYAELFLEERVLVDASATDAGTVLAQLASALCAGDEGLAGREGEVRAALEAREAQGSTGSQGVGIPHVKMPGLGGVKVALLVHHGGIDYRALDGEPVHVFFAVLRPEERAEEHLGLLRWIAGVAQHDDFLSFARQAGTPAAVVELLHEMTPA